MRALARSLLLTALLLGPWSSPTAAAFVLFSPPWRVGGGTFVINTDLSNAADGAVSPSGTSWDDAFVQALDAWNNAAGLGALIDLDANVGVLEDPCDSRDGVFGVGFRAVDACDGVAWGANTVALARVEFSGGGIVAEGNIIFRDDGFPDWDVVSGNQGLATDFRRVAVHEIGHLLGLDHPPGNQAIMFVPVQNAVEVPQNDDIQGVVALYDLGCPILTPAGSQTINGTLDATDCLDTEIPAGLTLPGAQGTCNQIAGVFDNDVLVDLYRVELPSGTPLGATMNASDFAPAVQVYDETLANELDCAWASRGGAAVLNTALSPGTYVVAARPVFQGDESDYSLVLAPEPGGSGAAAALAALAWWARHARRRSAPL